MSEKLAKLQPTTRIGGKGTPRRKVKKSISSTTNTSTTTSSVGTNGNNNTNNNINTVFSASAAAAEEKKLQTACKKLAVQTIPGIEEVNLFREDGNIIHLKAPRVQASVQCNTFIVSGNAQEKELTELVPGILDQLGPVSISNLKKIAEAYRSTGNNQDKSDAEEEDIPELVENFETISQ